MGPLAVFDLALTRSMLDLYLCGSEFVRKIDTTQNESKTSRVTIPPVLNLSYLLQTIQWLVEVCIGPVWGHIVDLGYTPDDPLHKNSIS